MDMALLDILALVIVLAGLLQGLMRGLGPAFGLLLWLIMALWLSRVLAPVVLGWMPNSGSANDAEAISNTYGFIGAILVLLPALAQLLGGTGGKKKTDPEPQNKFSGVLVGVLSSLLVIAWLTPYTQEVDALAADLDHAYTPSIASGVAGAAEWLYPDGHRAMLEDLASGSNPGVSGK